MNCPKAREISRKNFSKKFEKPLDFFPQMCYNKNVSKRGKPP